MASVCNPNVSVLRFKLVRSESECPTDSSDISYGSSGSDQTDEIHYSSDSLEDSIDFVTRANNDDKTNYSFSISQIIRQDNADEQTNLQSASVSESTVAIAGHVSNNEISMECPTFQIGANKPSRLPPNSRRIVPKAAVSNIMERLIAAQDPDNIPQYVDDRSRSQTHRVQPKQGSSLPTRSMGAIPKQTSRLPTTSTSTVQKQTTAGAVHNRPVSNIMKSLLAAQDQDDMTVIDNCGISLPETHRVVSKQASRLPASTTGAIPKQRTQNFYEVMVADNVSPKNVDNRRISRPEFHRTEQQTLRAPMPSKGAVPKTSSKNIMRALLAAQPPDPEHIPQSDHSPPHEAILGLARSESLLQQFVRTLEETREEIGPLNIDEHVEHQLQIWPKNLKLQAPQRSNKLIPKLSPCPEITEVEPRDICSVATLKKSAEPSSAGNAEYSPPNCALIALYRGESLIQKFVRSLEQPRDISTAPTFEEHFERQMKVWPKQLKLPSERKRIQQPNLTTIQERRIIPNRTQTAERVAKKAPTAATSAGTPSAKIVQVPQITPPGVGLVALHRGESLLYKFSRSRMGDNLAVDDRPQQMPQHGSPDIDERFQRYVKNWPTPIRVPAVKQKWKPKLEPCKEVKMTVPKLTKRKMTQRIGNPNEVSSSGEQLPSTSRGAVPKQPANCVPEIASKGSKQQRSNTSPHAADNLPAPEGYSPPLQGLYVLHRSNSALIGFQKTQALNAQCDPLDERERLQAIPKLANIPRPVAPYKSQLSPIEETRLNNSRAPHSTTSTSITITKQTTITLPPKIIPKMTNRILKARGEPPYEASSVARRIPQPVLKIKRSPEAESKKTGAVPKQITRPVLPKKSSPNEVPMNTGAVPKKASRLVPPKQICPDEKPKQTGTVPKKISRPIPPRECSPDKVPKRTGAVPKRISRPVSPKQTGPDEGRKKTGAMPKQISRPVSPKPTCLDVGPKKTGAVPKQIPRPVSPKQARPDEMPKKTGAIPKQILRPLPPKKSSPDKVRRQTGAVSKQISRPVLRQRSPDEVPKKTGAVPKQTGAIPKQISRLIPPKKSSSCKEPTALTNQNLSQAAVTDVPAEILQYIAPPHGPQPNLDTLSSTFRNLAAKMSRTEVEAIVQRTRYCATQNYPRTSTPQKSKQPTPPEEQGPPADLVEALSRGDSLILSFYRNHFKPRLERRRRLDGNKSPTNPDYNI